MSQTHPCVKYFQTLKKHLIFKVATTTKSWVPNDTLAKFNNANVDDKHVNLLGDGIIYSLNMIMDGGVGRLYINDILSLDRDSSDFYLEIKNVQALASFVDFISGNNTYKIAVLDKPVTISENEFKKHGILLHAYYKDHGVRLQIGPQVVTPQLTAIYDSVEDAIAQERGLSAIVFDSTQCVKAIFSVPTIQKTYKGISSIYIYETRAGNVLHINLREFFSD